MATPLVEMRDISIAFGGVQAVDHVSVDLYPGEVVGLLGHNGAGKSTLIKVLSGAYRADTGEVFVDGKTGPRSTTRAMPAPTTSRRSTRRWHWPTTSTRRRTCFWGGRSSPRWG